MKITYLILLFFFTSFGLHSQSQDQPVTKRVISTIDSSHANNLILTQTMEIEAAIDKVWEAFTTESGWESWSVPVADVDFRIGGLIQTSYDKNATIGDPGTIRLHVINFVPQAVITLQAELGENFPQFMLDDADELYNVILFEAISPTKTRITSHGLGYKSTPDYLSLLDFFVTGNESSYLQLISYLETGNPNKF